MNFKSRSSDSLPVSDPSAGLRRRLSSLSLNHLKTAYPYASGSWSSLCRSRSVSSMGEYTASSIKKWWDLGWSWVLSRKPTFAQDLEMSEDESNLLGFHSKGSLNHVFFKLRSELRKLSGSQNVGLPQTCKYNSFDNKNTTHLVY